ncbi:MAG TPA: hypothetical protein VLE93_02995 [Candidatus Saccharimonadales bacterium]|nr:hypothetical protein [Candidatus Saccharimonadales bacterium]
MADYEIETQKKKLRARIRAITENLKLLTLAPIIENERAQLALAQKQLDELESDHWGEGLPVKD